MFFGLESLCTSVRLVELLLSKHIPINEESLTNHLNSARNALLEAQIAGSGNANFVSGKMMFLQGSC